MKGNIGYFARAGKSNLPEWCPQKHEQQTAFTGNIFGYYKLQKLPFTNGVAPAVRF